MTSLVMTHYRPDNPTGGAPLRNWQNIQALGTFGPVDVVTVGTDAAPRRVEGVREWFPSSLNARSRWDRWRTACAPLRPGAYPGIERYYSADVRAWLRKRACRYDLAVIETAVLAAYVGDLKHAAARVVFDAHNVEAVLQPVLDAPGSEARASFRDRLKRRVLARRLQAAERRAIASADVVWSCSEVDARAIARLYGRRDGVAIVPNGVDLDAYRRENATAADADWSDRALTMVYTGLFAYRPNEEAALRLIREVLPAIRARGYDARILLVGREPTRSLLAAARSDPAITVTGAVPSVVPYLDRPCVVTVPLAIGSGTRLKIVEAFAAARPVVSTAKGMEGIDAVDGEHLLVRDDIDGMAEAVIALWSRRTLRARICANALSLVRRGYSWASATERIARSLQLPLPSATQPAAARKSW